MDSPLLENDITQILCARYVHFRNRNHYDYRLGIWYFGITKKIRPLIAFSYILGSAKCCMEVSPVSHQPTKPQYIV